MASLKPNLLSDDLKTIMVEATDVAKHYMRRNLYPEVVLWVMIQHQNTAAYRLLRQFVERRGADLEHLQQQVRLAAMGPRHDKNGDLDFLLPDGTKFPISHHLLIALDDALTIAQSHGEVHIDTDHLLVSMTDRRVSTGLILQQHGITAGAANDLLDDRTQIRRRKNATLMDHVEAARSGELPKIHERKTLLRDMINILSQSINRHIILVGPDGVGKRSLGYALAHLITREKGPLGIGKFIQIDERALLDNPVEAMQSAIMRARGGILFVPHLHRFFGGPVKAEFPKSGQNLQKAFLSYDPVIVATTTLPEWEERVSRVTAISEHAQVLRVDEPSEEETLEILRVLQPQLAADYDIDIDDNALTAAVRMAKRYIGTMPLPRSAAHLLHRAGAMVSMNQQAQLAFKPDLPDNVLDSEDITLAVAQMTGIPVSNLDHDERTKYASMVEHLHQRIIGQDEAVLAVSRAVKTARVGLKDPRRPIGSFLFLGPSGGGKTELAKSLAEFLFGSEDAMLQIDMSEYMEENTVSRLVGAPPGYVGYEGGGQLTDRVRDQPYIVVLFDEVEKAHSRIVDILLQVLEEGRLTDAQGNVATFSEAVVIMTSNLGAEYLSTTVITDEIREQVLGEVKGHFRPEFLNRLDDIIIFHPLSENHLYDILGLMLAREQQLGAERGLSISFTQAAQQWMIRQNETPEYGARPLRRIIQRNVREPLADFLLNGTLPEDGTIHIDAHDEGLVFETNSEG
ncbi:MAG: ATP-dependent Clp protease ATP-binding subunit [Chloroflexi bacterium]|nr:ATP-dependent Clp protease ATP-binding subunit [Chloroflexota bacterium]